MENIQTIKIGDGYLDLKNPELCDVNYNGKIYHGWYKKIDKAGRRCYFLPEDVDSRNPISRDNIIDMKIELNKIKTVEDAINSNLFAKNYRAFISPEDAGK